MYKGILLILVTLLFVSCGEQKEEEMKPAPKKTITMSQNTAISAGEAALSVENPWARPAVKDRNSAIFFDIVNSSNLADTLLAAESDAAKLVEVHETYNKSEDMMGMRHVEFVEIPANETFKFKPKSYHVMLIGLTNNLAIGDTITFNLEFAIAGKLESKAVVQDVHPKM